MAGIKTSGFTVIELMLFLSITGALFAVLIIGVNMNITQQRYKESVLNYSSLLQAQYSEALNTRNEEHKEWSCRIESQSTDGETRVHIVQQPSELVSGQGAPCVLLGRAIKIEKNGTVVRTSSVIGKEPTEASSKSDLEVLREYLPASTTHDEQFKELDWGSSLKTAGTSSVASILILRSPSSGLLRVFASSEELPTDLRDMITEEKTKNLVRMCVEGQAPSLPISSVSVNPQIGGPDGILVNGADESC